MSGFFLIKFLRYSGLLAKKTVKMSHPHSRKVV